MIKNKKDLQILKTHNLLKAIRKVKLIRIPNQAKKVKKKLNKKKKYRKSRQNNLLIHFDQIQKNQIIILRKMSN